MTATTRLFRFRVEQTRYTDIWVEGPDEATAAEDAEILASELRDQDWDDIDTDVDTGQEATPTRKVKVWSGGPDGHDYVFEPPSVSGRSEQ